MADAPGITQVLVTRPLHDAGRWIALLQEGGFRAEALPLIEISPLDGSAAAALNQAWQKLEAYAALMFVSANAVNGFFQQKTAPALLNAGSSATNNVANRRLPATLRLQAPGPGTVAALLAYGVPPGQIDAPPADAPQFDSEALWRVIGSRDWSGQRVLVLRGQLGQAPADEAGSGRDWLVRQWTAAGARVDMLAVYQRSPPRLGPLQLQRALQASTDRSVWLFSSSEAIANLAAQPGLGDLDWSRARAIVTHPRIAQAARAAGWGRVFESRPAMQDILRALRSIESDHS